MEKSYKMTKSDILTTYVEKMLTTHVVNDIMYHIVCIVSRGSYNETIQCIGGITMKIKIFINCILCLWLVGSVVAVYATPTSVSTLTNDTDDLDSIYIENLHSNIPIGDILMGMESTFSGEGQYYFHYNSGYLKFYIENTGSNAFYYTVKYPCGCKLVCGKMEAGKQNLFDHFDPTLHGSGYGHTPVGQYHVYLYNDDGSLSSAKLCAQSIKK